MESISYDNKNIGGIFERIIGRPPLIEGLPSNCSSYKLQYETDIQIRKLQEFGAYQQTLHRIIQA